MSSEHHIEEFDGKSIIIYQTSINHEGYEKNLLSIFLRWARSSKI